MSILQTDSTLLKSSPIDMPTGLPPQLIQSLPTPSWPDWIRWLLRYRRLYHVINNSMQPTLQPGDAVLADLRTPRRRILQPGEVVIARHPQRGDLSIIKRVTALDPQGNYFLSSDNPIEGTDSRSFGTVPPALVLGLVTNRIPHKK